MPKSLVLRLQDEMGVCVCSLSGVRLFVTPWTVAGQAPLSMGILQGRNTGVGCHVLLQGIFPIQGSNPGLPHCRWILYHLSHQGRSGEAQMGERFQSSQPGARATVSTKSVMTLTLAYSGPTPPLPQAQGREQGPGVAVAVKGTDSEKTGTA